MTAKIRQDIYSVRKKVDKLFQTAALDLSEACSSDEEIKKEMQEALKRWAKGETEQ